MSFDKHFYRQFKKDIDSEGRMYDAHSESKELRSMRCKHKQARIIRGELRCKCGAAWSGPRINDLLNKFRS